MPRRPQKDSKRRKGPSGPEQLARKQAREASDEKPLPVDSPAAPLEEPMDEAPPAVEAAAQDAGPEDVAAPAPTPAPARRAPQAGSAGHATAGRVPGLPSVSAAGGPSVHPERSAGPVEGRPDAHRRNNRGHGRRSGRPDHRLGLAPRGASNGSTLGRGISALRATMAWP